MCVSVLWHATQRNSYHSWTHSFFRCRRLEKTFKKSWCESCPANVYASPTSPFEDTTWELFALKTRTWELFALKTCFSWSVHSAGALVPSLSRKMGSIYSLTMESNPGFSEPFAGKKRKRTELVLVIETFSTRSLNTVSVFEMLVLLSWTIDTIRLTYASTKECVCLFAHSL